MRKAVLIGWLMLWAATATAATALPSSELHRLAAYLAYITATLEPEGPGGGSMYTVGANCPECNGVGKVGDGVTMLTCEWEDGLHYCNKGKIAKRSDGDAMDYEVDEAMCESVCDCGNCDGNCGGGCCDNCKCGTPERDELFEAIENAPLDFNESTVRELEYDLEKALEEVETLRQCCPAGCPNCADPQQAKSQEETPVEEPSSDVLTIYKMPNNTKWNWNGRSNPSTEYMRSHLKAEHGIDTSGMSREQLQIIHNNAHNYGDDMALGTATYEAKSSGSSSSCPSGTCPTSGSSSRSRGFFRR